MLKHSAPNLMVTDVDAATSFYEALGFRRVSRVPKEGGTGNWAMLTGGDAQLMLQSIESIADDLPVVGKDRSMGGAWVNYLTVSALDEVRDALPEEATVVVDIRETFYGSREFYIADPDGYIIGFAEPAAD